MLRAKRMSPRSFAFSILFVAGAVLGLGCAGEPDPSEDSDNTAEARAHSHAGVLKAIAAAMDEPVVTFDEVDAIVAAVLSGKTGTNDEKIATARDFFFKKLPAAIAAEKASAEQSPTT